MKSLLTLITILTFICFISFSPTTILAQSTNEHSDNWAVIVSTSKYWFNYRHNSDALTVYHMIKAQGIPDSNIILMIPEDVACTTKNVVPATVFNTDNAFPKQQTGVYNNQDYYYDNFKISNDSTNSNKGKNNHQSNPNNHNDNNLYDEGSIEVDYKGDDVTVENFLRILTGRHDPNTPRNKRLMSNANSNLFIYLSGHGGDKFLKFRDAEILTAHDLEYAVNELYISKRFKNTFLVVETCQAATLVEGITTPNVITSASSLRGENSYSHGSDPILGVSVVDKYSYYLHHFYTTTNQFQDTHKANMKQLLSSFDYNLLHSTHEYRTELFEFASLFKDKNALQQSSLIHIFRSLGLPESNYGYNLWFEKNGIPDIYRPIIMSFLHLIGLPEDDEKTSLIVLDQKLKERDVGDLKVLDFFGASLRTTKGHLASFPVKGGDKKKAGGYDLDIIQQFSQTLSSPKQNQEKHSNQSQYLFQSLPSIQSEIQQQHDIYQTISQSTSRTSMNGNNNALSTMLLSFLPSLYILSIIIIVTQIVYYSFFYASESTLSHLQ